MNTVTPTVSLQDGFAVAYAVDGSYSMTKNGRAFRRVRPTSGNQNRTAAVLAVVVGSASGALPVAGRASRLHEQRLSLVRGLLADSGGHEIDPAGGGACWAYPSWRQAIGAATELASEIRRLTTQMADVWVGIGLDVPDTLDAAAVAERARAMARSAEPNEIRLSESLAAISRQDPPDRHVVLPIHAELAPQLETVYRLANARAEVPSNLVTPATSFVGREAEIGAIRQLLGDTRLVTVTGPPGAGKTRIAVEVGERLLGRFDDGAWFVELAPVADPRLMMSTLAEALGLRPATDGSLLDAVSAYLRTRNLLVILDNFEHITEAATELVPLLAAAPGLRMVVTSRTVLRISGEHEYALPPLGLPAQDVSGSERGRSEAVELFARRAAASQTTFRLTEDNAAAVGELCRRLDGLPLAIELAAARIKLLPLPAMLARLDHRLRLLTGGPRDLPARHRTLRAAIASSYDLLEPPAKGLFRRLSVFRGGWTVDGAAALCGIETATQDAVLEILGLLLDASLVTRYGQDAELPRFTMLETIREFAAERLEEASEADTARALHAAHYIELAERLEPELTGVDQAAALERISIEHDNLRGALDYLLAAKPEDALRLSSSMWRFWQMRGHLAEGSRRLFSGLQAAGDDAPAWLRSEALAAAGGLAYWRGDMADAQQHYERVLALRREIGDDGPIADALVDLAFVHQPRYHPPPEDPERTARATRALEEAEDLYRRVGDEPGIAKALWLIGGMMASSDAKRATELLGASVERYRELNDPFGLGWALYSYGDTLLSTGDPTAAAAALGEALRLFAAAQDGSAMGMLLDDFAAVAKAEGDALRAARLMGAAAGMRQLTEAQLAVADDSPWRARIDAADGAIDTAALDRAWAEGQAMSQAEAVAYALGSDAGVVPDGALRVAALGPFQVERFGQPVSHWGGPKAGSRQAQAMFAFLLDRGDRGVTKDEFIEVIWPDAELTPADLNFHRTLGGLRTTLEPGKQRGSGGPIPFASGRYRLDPSVVGWLDAEEFEQRLVNAALATDEVSAIRGLEAARSLYRGEYLDDCPLYGDSEYVEERRGFFRGRLVDALVDLGRRYEARGDRTLAAARFREALRVSGGDSTSAAAGLERLGVSMA